jgi:hypothetical protein
MFELLGTIGGIWFLLFIVIIFVGGIISAEFDSLIGAVLTFAFMFGGFLLFFDLPFSLGLFESIFMVATGVVGYVIIGLMYGIWYRYSDWLYSQSERMKRRYGDYALSLEKDQTPTKDGFRSSNYYDEFKPIRNLDRITAWIALWPWAVFWDLCHKPARLIYNTVYDIAARALDAVNKKISDKILDNIK